MQCAQNVLLRKHYGIVLDEHCYSLRHVRLHSERIVLIVNKGTPARLLHQYDSCSCAVLAKMSAFKPIFSVWVDLT